MSNKVLVWGASTNTDRYSYLAANMLLDFGHAVVLVSNKPGNIRGNQFQAHWPAEGVDTITVYVGTKNQGDFWDLLPINYCRRVIFNPGTENPEAYAVLNAKGIKYEEACTLVLLQTNQF